MPLSERNTQSTQTESTPESRTAARRAKHSPVSDLPTGTYVIGGESITVQVTETKKGYTQLETVDEDAHYQGISATRADAIALFALDNPDLFTQPDQN